VADCRARRVGPLSRPSRVDQPGPRVGAFRGHLSLLAAYLSFQYFAAGRAHGTLAPNRGAPVGPSARGRQVHDILSAGDDGRIRHGLPLARIDARPALQVVSPRRDGPANHRVERDHQIGRGFLDNDLLGEKLTLKGAIRAGTGFLGKNADGVTRACGNGAEPVTWGAQGEAASGVVRHRHFARVPIIRRIPAIGGNQG